MILAVDNGSSYTGRLLSHLEEGGVDFEPRRFDQVEPNRLGDYSHYILSGRRRNDHLMNRTNSEIIRLAIRHKKPLLGICYGAELLALTAGGTIRRMDRPVKGGETVDITRDNPLCSGRMGVFESHAYEIARMPPPLETVGSSATCRNEMVRYGDLPIYGTQFHPEMTGDGLDLIANFLA